MVDFNNFWFFEKSFFWNVHFCTLMPHPTWLEHLWGPYIWYQKSIFKILCGLRNPKSTHRFNKPLINYNGLFLWGIQGSLFGGGYYWKLVLFLNDHNFFLRWNFAFVLVIFDTYVSRTYQKCPKRISNSTLTWSYG